MNKSKFPLSDTLDAILTSSIEESIAKSVVEHAELKSNECF